MLKNKLRLVFLVGLLFNFSVLFSQKQKEAIQSKIGLKEVMSLAVKNSLEAFGAKQRYGVNYWKFQAFKSGLLPKVRIEATPFHFNRSLVKRYDSKQNIDLFREQQSLFSSATLSINQNIRATGTHLFVSSELSRLQNSGDYGTNSYTATPIRIGFNQPIMAFNPFKWQAKIAPLEYQKAKRDLVNELQTVNLKTINLFFDWAMASKRVVVAEESKQTAEKLFKIGKKRYELGSIERDDILNLELAVYNARTNLVSNKQNLSRAEEALKLFLREKISGEIAPKLPEIIPDLQIDTTEALSLAYTNNPKLMNLELQKLRADRDLDRTLKENRFDLSISAGYGLNQEANTFRDAYGNLLDRQIVSVRFSMPVLDWGERREHKKMAQINREMTEIDLLKQREQLEFDLVQKVMDFNLQRELVEGALKAGKISRESYKITERRFLLGNLDYLRLVSARRAWQNALESYMRNLERYWRLYYEVQKLTLYDFIHEKPVEQDFDEVL